MNQDTGRAGVLFLDLLIAESELKALKQKCEVFEELAVRLQGIITMVKERQPPFETEILDAFMPAAEANVSRVLFHIADAVEARGLACQKMIELGELMKTLDLSEEWPEFVTEAKDG